MELSMVTFLSRPKFNPVVVALVISALLFCCQHCFVSAGDQKYVVTRKMESIVPMNKEEAVFMAKFPGGTKPEGPRRAPIEREDWPAPPEPAAAYPELCTYLPTSQCASCV